jgi:anti-anti-sigma factor
MAIPSRAVSAWFAVEDSASETGDPVIVIHGDVNMASAPELTDLVGDAIEGIPDKLILDLSNLKSLGLAGVRVIDYAARSLPAASAIVLRHPQPRVRKVLELTHTDDFCTIEG